MYARRLLVASKATNICSRFSAGSGVLVTAFDDRPGSQLVSAVSGSPVQVLPVWNCRHCHCCHKHSVRTAPQPPLRDQTRQILCSATGMYVITYCENIKYDFTLSILGFFLCSGGDFFPHLRGLWVNGGRCYNLFPACTFI